MNTIQEEQKASNISGALVASALHNGTLSQQQIKLMLD